MVRWWHLAALLAVVGPANGADLSLRRIMLSSGGVGYFQYEATGDGNGTLSLDVPIDQVDYILKSLVVYDDGGTAGEITLPGREPLTQAFVDLPFDRAALGGRCCAARAPAVAKRAHATIETACSVPDAGKADSTAP